MVIKEIWVPEAVAAFFLALPLFMPFIRSRRRSRTRSSSSGLAWLPIIAFGIMAGIIPAYGFRYECLPMLVFALFISIANGYPFFSGAASRSGSSLYERKPLFAALMLFFLVAAAVPMFVFSPRPYPQTTGDSAAQPRTQALFQNSDYILRIYEAAGSGANRPVVFLVPPEIGSAASVELVCEELQGMGYTVVSYFRRGLDSPMLDENGRRRPASPALLLTYWRVFRRAASLSSLNETGKALEAERRADIEYLLPRIPALLSEAWSREERAGMTLLLVGYGAGGSALAYLAGEEGFASRHRNVLGAVAIEGRLWSSYQEEPRLVPEIHVPAGSTRSRPSLSDIGDWFQRQWSALKARLYSLRPQRVARTGPLPGESFSEGLPVLHLVSGRALADQGRGTFAAPQPGGGYQAIFDTLRSASGPVALAAIDSAGPLDYQDFPFTHPVFSFLLPGLKDARKSENPVSDTAGIIGNYASYLLGSPARRPIDGNLYIESRGMLAFRL